MKLPKITVDKSKATEIIVDYEKKKAVNELLALGCIFALTAYIVLRNR